MRTARECRRLRRDYVYLESNKVITRCIATPKAYCYRARHRVERYDKFNCFPDAGQCSMYMVSARELKPDHLIVDDCQRFD